MFRRQRHRQYLEIDFAYIPRLKYGLNRMFACKTVIFGSLSLSKPGKCALVELRLEETLVILELDAVTDFKTGVFQDLGGTVVHPLYEEGAHVSREFRQADIVE